MDKENKNGIIYRKMGIKDIDGVLDVENRAFSIPWSRNMFVEELNNPGAVYYVALVNEVIVAYTGVQVILDEGHITNLAVDPSCRRQHIAFGLMRKIIEMSRDIKLVGLTLEVRAGNLPAISLYERFGFKAEGIRKSYYSDNNEDAIIMWCYFDI